MRRGADGAVRARAARGLPVSAAALFAPVPAPPAGERLVVTLDALVSGVHFPADTAPADVAFKALAVNLSDLAAMGALAVAAQATCEAPDVRDPWCAAVAAQLRVHAGAALPVAVQAALAAGPERRVCVQAMGRCPPAGLLTRDGAVAGDRVWVSGTLGDAGAGLAVAQHRLEAGPGADRDHVLARLARPAPRLALGRALRGVASAAIDVSDGIAGDAGHIARRSAVAIVIEAARLPLSGALRRIAGDAAGVRLAAYAGDDYELLFTAPPAHDRAVAAAGRAAGVAVHHVGDVVTGSGVTIADATGRALEGAAWQHFRPGSGR